MMLKRDTLMLKRQGRCFKGLVMDLVMGMELGMELGMGIKLVMGIGMSDGDGDGVSDDWLVMEKKNTVH